VAGGTGAHGASDSHGAPVYSTAFTAKPTHIAHLEGMARLSSHDSNAANWYKRQPVSL